MVSRGHHVTIVTADLGEDAARDLSPQLQIRVIRPLLPGAICRPSEFSRLRSLFCSHDIVHLHGMWEYANIQIGRLCALQHKPYIVSPHGMLDSWSMNQRGRKKKTYLRLFGSRWLNAAAGIHITTQFEREQASVYFPGERGRVIPLMVDFASFSPAPISTHAATVNRPLRVLYLSRIDPKKSIETLLCAAKVLGQRDRQVSLVVAGSGEDTYLAKMKSLANDLRLNVQFVGMVTGPAKARLYSSCDVFALPTQHENFGIVYLEALASGLPVVTTPTTGLSPDLHESGAALVVERSPQHFADAIESLILDPGKRVHMSACGREWVLRRFDREAIAAQFEHFYFDITHSSRHSTSLAMPNAGTVTICP